MGTKKNIRTASASSSDARVKRPRFLLRVEATNLGACLDDTSDLSTGRGGGLMLLDAVILAANLVEGHGAEVLSKGASVGVFSIDGDDLSKAKELAAKLRRHLAEAVPHATFAISIVRDTHRFRQTLESVRAVNAWQQMSAPSLAFPSPNGSDMPCDFDRVRPANSRGHDGPDGESLSSSVTERRRIGRGQKQEFYRRTLTELLATDGGMEAATESGKHALSGAVNLPDFVREFDELTAIPEAHHRRLAGKMAVFYADGNGFGKVQADLCHNADLQREFDRRLRRYRQLFLADVLGRAMQDGAWKTPEGRLRLEVLLWGGDELLLVVPAWCGWDVMEWFFAHTAQWVAPGGPRLRHGAGLVFCSHKAPIGPVKILARNLAELSKGVSRNEDLVAYEILESFDHTGEDLSRYRQDRWRPSAPTDGVLSPDAAGALVQVLRLAGQSFSNRSMHRLVFESRANGRISAERSTAIAGVVSGLNDEARSAWSALESLVPNEHARMLHLANLSDYIL